MPIHTTVVWLFKSTIKWSSSYSKLKIFTGAVAVAQQNQESVERIMQRLHIEGNLTNPSVHILPLYQRVRVELIDFDSLISSSAQSWSFDVIVRNTLPQ